VDVLDSDRARDHVGNRAGGALMSSEGESQRLARQALEPVEIAGPWWWRHRHWLTSPAPFVGADPIVVNMRTGATHGWEFRGNRQGRGWFGVQTRWVLVHPKWKRDP
jgi:hypothetical protein